MSYLARLIKKAVDTDLENNRIGKYSIKPQHGSNVWVYHIYKTDDKKRDNHIATINITDIYVFYQTITAIKGKDWVEISSIIKELYEETHEISWKSLD